MSTQQLLLGAGGATKKTYLDDVFSTFLYDGGSGDKTINNGLDMSGEGGMFWSKQRSDSVYGGIWDTERGASKRLRPDSNIAESTVNNIVKSFNNNGVTISSDGGTQIYDSGETHVSWSFRKAPGFFDVVKFTETGSDLVVSHSLGSLPGMILLKRIDAAVNWFVYHKSNPDRLLRLDTNNAHQDMSAIWLPTTTSDFTFKPAYIGYGSGAEWVAYVFAGGEDQTTATARSVDFDGDDSLYNTGSSSDYTMGTGDFTIECWANFTGEGTEGIFQISDQAGGVTSTQTTLGIAMWNDRIEIYGTGGTAQYMMPRSRNQWYHIAYVRHSGVAKIYVNGIQVISRNDTGNYNGTYLAIGAIYNSSSFDHNGKISNFRIVKGTAVYTSSFKPPTTPLTNITNTKLLCCNNSSTTGTTVEPGALTASGNPTASSDSPFEDPAAFVFGENANQDVVKCGTYIASTSVETHINLGWEPQFIIIKCLTQGTTNWAMFDSMRGIVTQGNEDYLYPSLDASEYSAERMSLTPTGFVIDPGGGVLTTADDQTYMYIAIRRPDPLVQKPQLATDVFAIDTGNSSSTIPNFDSGFPVDFAWAKLTGSTGNWYTSARLMQKKELKIDLTSVEATGTNKVFDSNAGWHDTNGTSGYISHMWKRHAGFDVVTANKLQLQTVPTGGQSHTLRHNLGKTPEMIWVKNRNNTFVWAVYHKGLNGGTNPAQNRLRLNQSDGEQVSQAAWNNTEPTSTHFTVGENITGSSGGSDYEPICFLFASVDGISKVGYYDGQDSVLTITTGFQPRFVILKCISQSAEWYVLDTTRGWGSGSDNYLQLHSNTVQASYDFGAPTSNGFTLNVLGNFNAAGNKYIYYAHA